METSEEIGFIAILLPLAGIILLIAIGVVLMHQQFQKNIIRQQLAREALKSEYQRKLLQSTISVQEKERKRIAKDLHDELGATLSISRMHLSQLEEEGIETNRMKVIREMIETTLVSTRRISHELMPPQLEKLGLERALRSILNKIESNGKLSTTIVMSEDCPQLPWLTEVSLYRIYSELINNTLKHAEANTIEISILCEQNQLFCRYADDGKGLNDTSHNVGLGLMSLESRIKSIEGEWEYGSKKNEGFYANIKIPTHQ